MTGQFIWDDNGQQQYNGKKRNHFLLILVRLSSNLLFIIKIILWSPIYIIAKLWTGWQACLFIH